MQRVQNTTGGGETALGELLALPEPPTAIVTATDVLAIGIIHAAYERDLNVPTDLSVVGFDDIPLASAMVPGLTTVQMPIAKMVAAGVQLAIGADARKDMDQASKPVIFKPKLIVRRSTAPRAELLRGHKTRPRKPAMPPAIRRCGKTLPRVAAWFHSNRPRSACTSAKRRQSQPVSHWQRLQACQL